MKTETTTILVDLEWNRRCCRTHFDFIHGKLLVNVKVLPLGSHEMTCTIYYCNWCIDFCMSNLLFRLRPIMNANTLVCGYYKRSNGLSVCADLKLHSGSALTLPFLANVKCYVNINAVRLEEFSAKEYEDNSQIPITQRAVGYSVLTAQCSQNTQYNMR